MPEFQENIDLVEQTTNTLHPVTNTREQIIDYDSELNEEINLVGEIADLYDEPLDFCNIEIESSSESSDEFDEEFDKESMDEIVYDNDHDERFQHFLHPSLTTTKMEALQMILIFFIRHNLTFAALEDMLLLINSLLKVNSLPTSKYNFFKCFPNRYKPKYNYYCNNKKCKNLLVSSSERNVIHDILCEICETENHINSKNEHCFITLPLKDQLEEIILQNSESLIEKPKINTSSSLQDIKDAEIYQTLVKNSVNNNPKISLVMNTDGVQVFKSNNKSLWPIQVIINELPIEKRFLIKNILVLGLYYDKHHPNMQHLLKPFMLELRDLSRTGMFYCVYCV